MVQLLEAKHEQKGLIKIPYCQFVLNDKQQFAALAIDAGLTIELGEHEGLKYNHLGKLEEQNFLFRQQIINSLRREQWNFDQYPNPDIVLITVDVAYITGTKPPKPYY